MTKVSDLHRKWSADPAYKAAYRALANEYTIPKMLIRARARVGLSQSEVAKRMKTSQSYVARLEAGQVNPTTDALARYAKAVYAILKFSFATGTGLALRNKFHEAHKVKVSPATGKFASKRDPKGARRERRSGSRKSAS